jgi:hypothetical protein
MIRYKKIERILTPTEFFKTLEQNRLIISDFGFEPSPTVYLSYEKYSRYQILDIMNNINKGCYWLAEEVNIPFKTEFILDRDNASAFTTICTSDWPKGKFKITVEEIIE